MELSELISRYNVNGPRYTSYPTANLFQSGDWQTAYMNALHDLGHQNLALYVHVPFCPKICYYCACNRIHTGNLERAQRYTNYLRREISLLAAHIGTNGRSAGAANVEQLHFGGGTPTFLSDDQFAELFVQLATSFNLSRSATRDFSIELDPRGLPPERLALLAGLGFNRLSIGVQDFDPQVQAAVNRLQSEQETAEVVTAARRHGFRSISFDLIYGLPQQTVAGFATTLQRVLQLEPDRLSIYSYAHLPERFKSQRQIDAAHLPSADTKLQLLNLAVEVLEEAGFVYVGMDHFAKPSDSLVAAMKNRTLHRNFMGYSSHGDCQLLGLGASSIGQTGSLYVQNVKDLDSYYRALDAHQFPLERGYQLEFDDQIR
ncbi:MAG: oxygen-independent coproporphyrinogen III oxidase, partial [Pseudomonadota bacterium]